MATGEVCPWCGMTAIVTATAFGKVFGCCFGPGLVMTKYTKAKKQGPTPWLLPISSEERARLDVADIRRRERCLLSHGYGCTRAECGRSAPAKVTGIEARLPDSDLQIGKLHFKADDVLEAGHKCAEVFLPATGTMTLGSGSGRLAKAIKAWQSHHTWKLVEVQPKPIDPLDVEHDGVPLRGLLEVDQAARREGMLRDVNSPSGDVEAVAIRRCFTPAQRAAVSAHWSAELRAKVAAGAERERQRVVVDLEEP